MFVTPLRVNRETVSEIYAGVLEKNKKDVWMPGRYKVARIYWPIKKEV
jgi:hypothetical protein